jgi:hypothetical protein
MKNANLNSRCEIAIGYLVQEVCSDGIVSIHI